MRRLTSRQRKALWALARKDGFDQRTLHRLVWSLTEKNSIRTLTPVEARRVIRFLDPEGKALNPARAGDFHQKGSSTAPQKRLIRDLAGEMNWPALRLRRLTRRMYGVSFPDALNRKQASGLIEALKAIKKRNAA